MGNRKFTHLVGLFATIIVFLVITIPIHAARGCCSWHGGVSGCDSSVGRYVCNDGTYSPSCGCAIDSPPVLLSTPTPTPTPFVLNIKAEPKFKLNEKATAYTVSFDWEDVYLSDGYSVGISKIAGADPGPLPDTDDSHWSFLNVKPGMWYLNLKSLSDSKWSNVVYWTVNLPTITATSTPAVKGLKTRIKISIKPTRKPTLKVTKPIATLIPRATNTPLPTNSPLPTQPTSKYICNCGKTCTQITSCEEAYFQLNTCGCAVRDGDHDGVPCENLCK